MINFLIVRLSVETERNTQYASELSVLKEQVASRDRVVIEVNSELEHLRQQTAQLSADYQTALTQLQLAQHAMYILRYIPCSNKNVHILKFLCSCTNFDRFL